MAEKSKETLAATTAERGETPLTDSLQASLKKGETPGIFRVLWHDGFTVAFGKERKFTRALVVHKYSKPKEHNGKKKLLDSMGSGLCRGSKNSSEKLAES
jgi:hypothetical protein